MSNCKNCNAEVAEGEEYCMLCDLNLDFSSEEYDSIFQDSEQVTFNENNELVLDDIQYNMEDNIIDRMKQEDSYDDDRKANEEEEDILKFLKSMDVGDDILALDDYMDGHSHDTSNDDTRVNDPETAKIEDELLRLIPDVTEIDNGSLISDDFQSKLHSNVVKPLSKPKKGVLGTLFGNVKNERSEVEVNQLKQEALEYVELKEKKAIEKSEKKTLAKQQRKKKATEKAAVKKANKVAAEKKKQEKLKAKKEAKSKKEIEIQNLMDEIDSNNGRINRIGASIIFITFAIIAIVIVIGTNIYTYSLSIENATKNFEIQRYNEAYNEVYGIDVKDEDIELYDKIMTVMFVNKQLNSYNNYSEMEKYPEALDSLLKGLERYDKYISLAAMLGIKTDLDHVRLQIISELNNVFKLTEEDALKLISIEDQEEYSIEVYDVVLEHMNTQLTKE